jgi:hypothetical protein
MSLTLIKYGFSISFYREQTFSVKLKANPFGFLNETRYFSNPIKIYVQPRNV